MDWKLLMAVIFGAVGLLGSAVNIYVMQTVKLAISGLETAIEKGRRADIDEVKRWAEERFQFKQTRHQHGD